MSDKSLASLDLPELTTNWYWPTLTLSGNCWPARGLVVIDGSSSFSLLWDLLELCLRSCFDDTVGALLANAGELVHTRSKGLDVPNLAVVRLCP